MEKKKQQKKERAETAAEKDRTNAVEKEDRHSLKRSQESSKSRRPKAREDT
jgi:hypothetical protein